MFYPAFGLYAALRPYELVKIMRTGPVSRFAKKVENIGVFGFAKFKLRIWGLAKTKLICGEEILTLINICFMKPLI